MNEIYKKEQVSSCVICLVLFLNYKFNMLADWRPRSVNYNLFTDLLHNSSSLNNDYSISGNIFQQSYRFFKF